MHATHTYVRSPRPGPRRVPHKVPHERTLLCDAVCAPHAHSRHTREPCTRWIVHLITAPRPRSLARCRPVHFLDVAWRCRVLPQHAASSRCKVGGATRPWPPPACQSLTRHSLTRHSLTRHSLTRHSLTRHQIAEPPELSPWPPAPRPSLAPGSCPPALRPSLAPGPWPPALRPSLAPGPWPPALRPSLAPRRTALAASATQFVSGLSSSQFSGLRSQLVFRPAVVGGAGGCELICLAFM